MTTAIQPSGGASNPAAGPSSSSLADVIDTILDKGLVIDAYVRLSLVGIELISIDARVVVASVDTYLRFAQAVNRLNIAEEDPKAGLPELVNEVTSGAAKSKTQGVLDAAGEKLGDMLNQQQPQRKKVRSQREDR
ncbi:Gas vesicle protein [Mycolicibacterium chubuense NBB4]|uniref:Gas vesicle protein A n=1 Tax=Mycolicibacterium chubuense (strain NBB4) TaxID=710421 RepID=I4BE45_MYCCN|nr:gas vesicle protein GvpJ [Mycolicibacterium chubuense]AFM15552.1 Gas vesicle protein [Mycolicibacterium chubuense NBB4]